MAHQIRTCPTRASGSSGYGVATRREERVPADERLSPLTTREREVVDMLMAGTINKVIGAELGISTRTVESHCARIMGKLGVDSLSDIFKLVFAAEGEEEKQF